jgi:hypothetical protein
MGIIELSQGLVTVLDNSDLEMVSAYQSNWYADKHHNTFYARSTGGKLAKGTYLHRLIMGVLDPYIIVDHKDLDGLNNKRHNLRIITQSQNVANGRDKPRRSPYKGVIKRGERWYAFARYMYIQHHLGVYDTAEEAAQSYDDFQRRVNPVSARFNFSGGK